MKEGFVTLKCSCNDYFSKNKTKQKYDTLKIHSISSKFFSPKSKYGLKSLFH